MTVQVQRVPAAAEKCEGLPIEDTNRKESDPPDEVGVALGLGLGPDEVGVALRPCATPDARSHAALVLAGEGIQELSQSAAASEGVFALLCRVICLANGVSSHPSRENTLF